MFAESRTLKDSLSKTGMVPDFLQSEPQTAAKVDEETQKEDAIKVMENNEVIMNDVYKD